MPCVFRGRSPVTNEHVFPRWLNRYLGGSRRQLLEQARYGENGFDLVYPSMGIDFRVRKVCAQCNNGWLSDLEAESIDVLHPLVSGLERQLVSLREQRQIAVWATKTAMVMDQTQAAPLLPTRQLARMRIQRAIPRGTRVWMGACDELFPIVTSHTVRIDHEPLDEPEAPWPVGYYAPMKIGHLCLYAYFPGVDVVIQHPAIYHIALARIWPRRGGSIAWPPPGRPSDGAGFEELADALWRELRLYRPENARQHGVRES